MKHYIVANNRQELDVLGKLEDEGFMWINSSKLPTEHTISEFPHVIIADNNKDKTIMWSDREVDFERNVVFDGRKEEKIKPRIYIVANKEQELAVLGSLEKEGFKWMDNDRPQEWLPSKEILSEFGFSFPYTIVAYKDKTITWSYSLEYPKGSAVFDGRKEEKMTEVKKYKVTKEFMDKLIEWRGTKTLDATSGDRYSYVGASDLDALPKVVKRWWLEDKNPMERNNRLTAIISWLNGDEVFEVEKPKFIVRSDKTDSYGDYTYVVVKGGTTATSYFLSNATKFSTREEAQEWANSHQVVIEVGSEG